MRPRSPIRTLALALVACLPVACDDGSEAAKADAETLKKASGQWTALRSCLIGAPLGDGEKASSRMKASELTLVARGDGEAKGATAWPSSCVPIAAELSTTLGALKADASVGKYAPLAKLLKELGDTGPTMMIATGDPVVDRVFAAAQSAGLAASAPAGAAAPSGSASAGATKPASSAAPDTGAGNVTSAPPASAPVPVEALAELGGSKGFIERVEKAPSETVRFMLGDSEAGAFFCALGSGEAPLDHARCATLEGAVNVAATPLSAESGEADYFFNPEPEPGVQQVGGERYDAAVGPTAFVFDDGTIGDVVPARPKPEMVRRLTHGKVERAPHRPPGGGGFLGFRGGAVAWRGPVRGASGRRPFVVQELQKGRAGLSGRIEVGEVPKHAENLAACRSGDQLHILVVDRDPSDKDMVESKRQVAVGRRDGKRWRKPVRSAIDVGAGATSWWDRGVKSFTCRGETSTFTWLREDRRVGQLRCGGDECKVVMSEPLPEISANEKLRVSNLGESALVVRTVRAMGPLTGLTELVTLRLAPVDELHSAAERVLLGDDKHGGLPDLHKSLGLVSIDSAAVVLVHSGPKIFGLRVDGKGEPTKLHLKKDGT